MPLGLASSEGLGISARGRWTRVHFHASHSASCSAPWQEYLRHSVSAAPSEDFPWRSAPCSAHHHVGFSASIPWLRAGRQVSPDLLFVHPSAGMPARSALLHRVAASGGLHVYLDWPALTPALTEIRLLVRVWRMAASSRHALPTGHSRLGRVVAVQFTPTGALPAGATHRGSSDA